MRRRYRGKELASTETLSVLLDKRLPYIITSQAMDYEDKHTLYSTYIILKIHCYFASIPMFMLL